MSASSWVRAMLTVTVTSTSGCRATVTSWMPSVLSGCVEADLRRSSVMPDSVNALAMSRAFTEP